MGKNNNKKGYKMRIDISDNAAIVILFAIITIGASLIAIFGK